VLAPMGFTVRFADPLEEDVFLDAARHASVVLLEPITNPLVRVVDVELLIPRLKDMGVSVLVDSTFATPWLLRPLALGADAVVHAASKYLSGHSDTTGGVLVGTQETVDRARSVAAKLGAAMSPFDAFLILRGIRTLALRLDVQSANALEIARRLSRAKGVGGVYYPLLPSDPHYERAWRILRGKGGGILSFELEGGLSAVRAFIGGLGLTRLVPGLADVATTVNHPATTSHRHLPDSEKLATGISDGLLRLSVGIEDAEDIWDDLHRGLEALAG
jgi:cystathionine beta-lyase/cystathionine gamma-synthase